jgi:chromatin remodeling complex protein RSC6
MKPLQPSSELAAVVGSSPLPRPEVVSKMWEYIKGHQLQNPQNKREILADDKLRSLSPEEGSVRRVIRWR